MRQIPTLLLIGVLTGPMHAVESAPPVTPGPIAASASREAERFGRAMRSEPRRTPVAQPAPARKGWIARHPALFGALVGFGAGCAVGGARVGGSEDNFFNALDEFACPVVGGIGAGAGAIVGALVR
jgi:branched-subunit amino acid ABC-type transport system permease component